MDRVALEQLLGAKVSLPRHSGKGITGWVDLVTLIAVLSGATLWGLTALGIAAPYQGWPARVIEGFIGLSALWQWCRQRL